jgi:hypothetical protein
VASLRAPVLQFNKGKPSADGSMVMADLRKLGSQRMCLDNYCLKRSWNMGFCPKEGTSHCRKLGCIYWTDFNKERNRSMVLDYSFMDPLPQEQSN